MKKSINELVSTSDKTELSAKEIADIIMPSGYTERDAKKYARSFPKVRRGVFDLSSIVENVVSIAPESTSEAETPMAPAKVSKLQSIVSEDVFIPSADACYVSWGNSKDVVTIIKSGQFYPTYISGLSGNGKTMMVEQACAKLNREYIRVQITPETDEDDLLGGFRLINGETVFYEGPVVKAMKAGAILLIDEIDRGSNKLMCLQGVLEGKPVLLKKTGQVVEPAPGFNVIATANTKGRGSEDGRFIAATIIDEAFLERFTITIDQPYATISIERKILDKHMEKFGCPQDNFSELLSVWSETIRKTYADGGIDELISTRRLCHIAHTYAIFGDRKKAIELCVNRFDLDVKEAFIDLYEKVDSSLGEVAPEAPEVDREEKIDEILNNL